MKKVSKLIVLLIILPMMGLMSCGICTDGNGKVVKAGKDLSEFSAIDFNLTGTLYLTQGEDHSIRIETEENLIEEIEVDVKNGELKIGSKYCINPSKDLVFHVTFKEVNDLALNGSGNIISRENIKSEELMVKLNGSGNIILCVEAEDIMSKINGSGNIEIEGKSQKQSIKINGSGDCLAAGLDTKNTSISINGSGDCEITTSQRLKVDIKGSGSVSYHGDPELIKDIKGSGEIVKKSPTSL